MASRAAYPSKAMIERMVAAAKACGLDVAGFEVSPTGSIRVIEARAVETTRDTFAEWEGRL